MLMEMLDEYRKQLRPSGKVYVFLDEVQEIEGWESVVNSLSQDYKTPYEVFVTGSNAHPATVSWSHKRRKKRKPQ